MMAMQRRSAAVQVRAQSGAFAGSRVVVAGLRAPRPVARAPAVKTVCGASPKGLPSSVSSYDDDIKEQSRKFRRTVFTFESWEGHRSSERYARHFLTMFTSRVVRGLARPLIYIAGVSSAVVAYETARASGVTPDWAPSVQLNSKEVFGLTSFALSLLLVFRTNASYERWDGARKMWGLMLNRSRDLVRQGLSYFPDDRPELREMLVRWTPAFSKSLMCHLRKDDDFKEVLRDILLPHELDSLLKATHRPNYALQVLSQIVKESNCGTAATMRMDDNITAFEDVLGGCERILKTPIPLSYTRHTSRFLMIWLSLLPFSLYGTCGASTVPLCTIIAFLLLGIEEIGVSIEEPFSILALEAISDSALNNSRELLAQHDAAKARAGGQLSAADLIAQERGLLAAAGGAAAAAEANGAGSGGRELVGAGVGSGMVSFRG